MAGICRANTRNKRLVNSLERPAATATPGASLLMVGIGVARVLGFERRAEILETGLEPFNLIDFRGQAIQVVAVGARRNLRS